MVNGENKTINYNKGKLRGRYDFVGVYDWMKTPLIEYYILE
ncbi:glycoside hydrolase family 11 protein [uncultured Aquimarina sp.]|nr:glycoside hydrolase family 11 protein [uncultured Aquimarina sp.]